MLVNQTYKLGNVRLVLTIFFILVSHAYLSNLNTSNRHKSDHIRAKVRTYISSHKSVCTGANM